MASDRKGIDGPAAQAAAQMKLGSAVVVAPLMWEGRGIGSLTMFRKEVEGLRERENVLFRPFADQAVIGMSGLLLDTPLTEEQRDFAATIRDTGIGPSEAGLARLFQKFSQADSSTTRKYGGTGLGLAISRLLAEPMGGAMWAESAGPGHGSSFHFTLACKAASLPEGSKREIIGEQQALKGKSILVADDNATNRRILARRPRIRGSTRRRRGATRCGYFSPRTTS